MYYNTFEENEYINSILAFDNLVVVSPDGVIVFDTRLHDLPIGEWLLGTQLRLNALYRNGSRIIVLYTWLGPDLPPGLLRFELGKGFTGRCDLS
jgi:hypothetical protein